MTEASDAEKKNATTQFCWARPRMKLARGHKIVECKTFSFLGVLLLGLAAPVSAHDWPQWGGTAARNMASAERGIPASFVPGKKDSDGSGIDLRTTQNVKWTAKLGNETYSSPAIAGGKVFIGTSDSTLQDPRFEQTGGGVLLCLDEATGRLLWRLVVPRLTTGRKSDDFDAMGLGICSSPAVDGDRVYVVTNRSEVLCLDANGMANGNDGPFLDEAPLRGPGGPSAGRTGAAGRRHHLAVRHDQLCRCFPMTPRRVPCSFSAMSCLWGRETASTTRSIAMPFGAELDCLGQADRPAPGRRQRANRRGGYFTANGRRRRWDGSAAGRWFSSAPATGCVTPSTPSQPPPTAAGLLHKVWSCDCTAPYRRDSRGKAIDYWSGDRREGRGNLNDGRFLSPCEIIGTPVFYKNRIYVAIGQDPQHGRGRGLLTCIDATKTGDITSSGKIWSYDKIDRSLSSVSIADGLVYAADMPGRVHCLDAESGQCYWVHDCQSDIWTSTLVVDGKVFVGTRKGFCVLAAGRYPEAPGHRSGWGRPSAPCRWLRMGRCTSLRSAICGPSKTRIAKPCFRNRHDQRAGRSLRPAPIRIAGARNPGNTRFDRVGDSNF